MPQDLPHGLDLVRQLLDAVQTFKAKQLVETPQEAQPGMLLVRSGYLAGFS
jgi:hypothetical protein